MHASQDGAGPPLPVLYCITSLDAGCEPLIVAAGMEFPKAVDLKKKMANRWPAVAFIVEEEPDPSRFCRPVYQLVGVNQDCSRTTLMVGMTLQEAEAARDELVKIADFLWVWIECEPAAAAEIDK